jgi:hypothetical protein
MCWISILSCCVCISCSVSVSVLDVVNSSCVLYHRKAETEAAVVRSDIHGEVEVKMWKCIHSGKHNGNITMEPLLIIGAVEVNRWNCNGGDGEVKVKG